MKREVYVDGVLVDSGNSYPAIVINNPIFIELSEITGSRTEQYVLPVTEKNTTIFEFSNDLNVESGYNRNVHVLSEYRNGIEVVKNARALLLGVENGYKFSVSWGSFVNLSDKLKVKLNELPSVGSLPWNPATPYMIDFDNYGWITLWNSIPEELETSSIEYVHPSVQVYWLISHIFNYIGYSFEMDTDVVERLKRMYINLTTKNLPSDWWNYTGGSVTIIGRNARNNYLLFGYYGGEDMLVGNNLNLPTQNKTLIRFNNITITSNTINLSMYNVEFEFIYVLDSSGNTETLNHTFYNRSNVVSINETIEKQFNRDDDDKRTIVYVRLWVVSHRDGQRYILNYPDDASIGGVLYFAEDVGVSFRGTFPIVENLPSIDALTFIKNIMFMEGLKVDVDVSNVDVRFSKIDDIIKEIPTALDLTKNVQDISKIDFSFQEYAKENVFDYSTDEGVETDASGTIIINDEKLSESKEVIKLDFSPSDNVSYRAYSSQALIPLYKKTDDGDIEYSPQNVSNRIVFASKIGVGILRGYFDESMLFENILDEKYILLGNILRRTKYVNVKIYVSDFDIQQMQNHNMYILYGLYFILVNAEIVDNVANCNFIRYEYDGSQYDELEVTNPPTQERGWTKEKIVNVTRDINYNTMSLVISFYRDQYDELNVTYSSDLRVRISDVLRDDEGESYNNFVLDFTVNEGNSVKVMNVTVVIESETYVLTINQGYNSQDPDPTEQPIGWTVEGLQAKAEVVESSSIGGGERFYSPQGTIFTVSANGLTYQRGNETTDSNGFYYTPFTWSYPQNTSSSVVQMRIQCTIGVTNYLYLINQEAVPTEQPIGWTIEGIREYRVPNPQTATYNVRFYCYRGTLTVSAGGCEYSIGKYTVEDGLGFYEFRLTLDQSTFDGAVVNCMYDNIMYYLLITQ